MSAQLLPDFLVGSYERYKEDTNVWTTWLSKTAIACGYKPPDPTNVEHCRSTKPKSKIPIIREAAPVMTAKSGPGRLKGKARKEAKVATAATTQEERPSKPDNPLPSSVKHQIKTVELIQQAEAILSSGNRSVQLPWTILRIVERAIEARRRCSAWFDRVGVNSKHSVDGHAHFIDVLQKTVDILKPLAQKRTPHIGIKASRSEANGRQPTTTADLTNKFTLLQVEEISDNMDLVATDVSVVVNQSKKAKKPTVKEIYEVELQTLVEQTFAIYCFFEDLHEVQEFLGDTWNDWRKGTIDLLTASLTTNAALALVRRMEDDLIAESSKDRARPNSFARITNVVYHVDAIKKGNDHEDRFSPFHPDFLAITKLDDFLYLSTARTMVKYHMQSKAAYPQPVKPIKAFFLACPSLMVRPEIKRWADEDEALTHLMLDVYLTQACVIANSRRNKGSDRSLHSLAEDEITRGIMNLIESGEISVANVFASRIWLDIRAVVGTKISQPFESMTTFAEQAHAKLDVSYDGHNALPGGKSGMLWWTQNMSDVTDIIHINDFLQICPEMKKTVIPRRPKNRTIPCSFNDIPEEIKRKVGPMLASLGLDAEKILPQWLAVMDGMLDEVPDIAPHEDNLFALSHNPLYSGITYLNLALRLEGAGLALSNHHKSILAFAHLYNALLQGKFLKKCWPAFDRCIELHKVGLFGGKQLPTTQREMRARLAFKLGVPASHFASNRRTPNLHKAQHGKFLRDHISGNEICEILREQFSGKMTLERALYRIEPLLETPETLLKTRRSSSTTPMKRSSSNMHVSPVQFLAQLQSSAPNFLASTNTVDYLTITRLAAKCLLKVNSEIEARFPELKIFNSSDLDRSCSRAIIDRVSDIMEEIVITQDFHAEGKVNTNQIMGPTYEVAAEVVNEWLEMELPKYGQTVVDYIRNEKEKERGDMFEDVKMTPKVERALMGWMVKHEVLIQTTNPVLTYLGDDC